MSISHQRQFGMNDVVLHKIRENVYVQDITQSCKGYPRACALDGSCYRHIEHYCNARGHNKGRHVSRVFFLGHTP